VIPTEQKPHFGMSAVLVKLVTSSARTQAVGVEKEEGPRGGADDTPLAACYLHVTWP